jgi:hypothetical protein
MRSLRGRTKKLLIAFHFQFSNRAAWDCDECRNRGLVKIRNCAFAGEAVENPARPVWVRRGTASCRCPKSIVTPVSLSFLEQFQVWKRFGDDHPLLMDARTAEAIALLDDAWEAEQHAHTEGSR